MRRQLHPTAMDFLLHWLILLLFWSVLSGMFDVFHLSWGLLCTGLVTFASQRLQLINLGGTGGVTRHLAGIPWHKVFTYNLWLLREVALANWQVLRIVLAPRLPIDPTMIRFRTAVRSDLGITLFANSITLTPGTITAQVREGEFLVHSLVSGEPVVVGLGEIQQRVIGALATIENDDGGGV